SGICQSFFSTTTSATPCPTGQYRDSSGICRSPLDITSCPTGEYRDPQTGLCKKYNLTAFATDPAQQELTKIKDYQLIVGKIALEFRKKQSFPATDTSYSRSGSAATEKCVSYTADMLGDAPVLINVGKTTTTSIETCVTDSKGKFALAGNGIEATDFEICLPDLKIAGAADTDKTHCVSKSNVTADPNSGKRDLGTLTIRVKNETNFDKFINKSTEKGTLRNKIEDCN
ncbi:MAG: hypothetical protein V1872_14220, partial [bacterium]